MKRYEHTLEPNKNIQIPRLWLFFDVENYVKDEIYKIVMPFRFGYAIYWRYDRESSLDDPGELFYFDNPDDFVKLIEKKCRANTTLHLAAHNVRHDICSLDLLRRLTAHGWELTSLYEEQSVVVIRLRKKSKRIIIVDTLNFFRGKLADFAKLVKIEKIEVDFNDDNEEKLRLRCKNDVLILQRMIAQYIKFIINNNLGSIKLTAAGQAFAAFRHRFYHTTIRIHNNEEVLALERAGYFGGMVRCWKIGEYNGEFYQLDINSLYPYVMSQYDYPTRLLSYRKNVSLTELHNLVKKFCVVADLTVFPKEPIFPHRTPDKIIVYPCYAFRSVFTTPEIEYLLAHNWIVSIHRVSIYKRANIFKDYVENIYALRLEFRNSGNKIYEYLCKQLLNSLYGKFGSKSKRLERANDFCDATRIVTHVYDRNERIIKAVYYFSDNPNEPGYVLVEEGEAFNSFPAIASHVTAYGRLMLWEIIKEAGLKNCYYSDTDSIIVNKDGFTNLSKCIDTIKLGYLKIEGKASHIIIQGRKDYLFGEKRVLKGIPEVNRIYNGNTTKREIWPSIRGWHSERKRGEYAVYRQTITLSRKLRDGFTTGNGTVYPFNSPPEFDPNPLADPLEEFITKNTTPPNLTLW